jgi:hypothetical protein
MAEWTAMLRRRAIALATVVAAAAAAPGLDAQLRAPRATLTPAVETTRVRAGRPASIALTVALPGEIHVQSDKPRDPALFPTALVLTPPAGVTVTKITYPPAKDFRQEGQPEPLAVFEKTFTVIATLSVAPSVAPGEIVVPGRFDYQACDDKLCYRPVKTDVAWTLTVVP